MKICLLIILCIAISISPIDLPTDTKGIIRLLQIAMLSLTSTILLTSDSKFYNRSLMHIITGLVCIGLIIHPTAYLLIIPYILLMVEIIFLLYTQNKYNDSKIM